MFLKSVLYRLLIYKENSTNCYFSIYLLGWETLVTKDSVILGNGNAIWSLDYVANNLEIRVKGEVPLLGFQKQLWTFPDGFPQNNMIATIEEFIKGQIQQQDQIRDRKLYGY